MGFQSIFSLDSYQINALDIFRKTSRMDVDLHGNELPYPHFVEASMVARHVGRGVKITGDYIIDADNTRDFSRTILWEKLLADEYTITLTLEEMQAILYAAGNASWEADLDGHETRREKWDALCVKLDKIVQIPAKAAQNFKNYTEEK